jgi:hypothetical protein
MSQLTGVPVVQAVQPLRSVHTPTSVLPRDAGEDEEGGLNDLNGLSGLNGFFFTKQPADRYGM